MFKVTPSLRAKWVFLSFLQEYFKDHKKYTWNQDPKKTEIIITDKHSTELGVAAKRPSIILDRGNFSWTNTTRREALPNRSNESYMHQTIGGTRKSNHHITDIWRGSLTFMCMSDNSFVADDLANTLFYILLAYKESFKSNGLQGMEGPRMGQESTVRLQAQGQEIVNVPVSLGFQKSETLSLADKLFNCRVYDSKGREYYENIEYVVQSEGTQILLLFDPPEGETFTIDYIDAITLNSITEENLTSTEGNNRLYTVLNNGKIYGYYKILSSVEFYKDNTKWTQT